MEHNFGNGVFRLDECTNDTALKLANFIGKHPELRVVTTTYVPTHSILREGGTTMMTVSGHLVVVTIPSDKE